MEKVLLGYGLRDFMLYFVNRSGELHHYRAPEQMTHDAQLIILKVRKTGTDKDPALKALSWR